nr:hypothetical protein [Candidatus Saccharibacteria bacterium]
MNDYTADFVRSAHEKDDSINDIEERVLESIRRSDFVWLFAPEGYVGVSASFEIGFAYSLGIPVFTDSELNDEMLKTMITKIAKEPSDVKPGGNKPGQGILGLQRHYDKVAKRCGWSKESPKDTMLLLTEEMGELAREIRKVEGLKRDDEYKDMELQDELADVQIYLVHLANIMGIDLSEAVTEKIRKNNKRHN